jgi:PAS domain S-box-containing protein
MGELLIVVTIVACAGGIFALRRCRELERGFDERVRESEERYRLLFNSGDDMVFVTALTEQGMPGQFIQVNDAVCRRLGYTREELSDLTPLDLVVPEHRGDFPPPAQRPLAAKGPLFETVIRARDGTRIPVEIDVQLSELCGRPVALATARDISGRKWAETELSQRLQEQELLFAIGQLISSSLQIDEVAQLVAEQMTYLVNAASCAISDWDPAAGTLTVRAEYIRPDVVDPDDQVGDLGQVYTVSNYPTTAAALRDCKPFVVYADDPEADPQECRLLERYRWHGVAGIPLAVQDRVFGLAEVYLAHEGERFESHDLRLLQALATQIAVAIDNARLFTVAQANEAAMRDLSMRLINVQEQERRLIAQELHDELGQLLTATKINVDLARRKLAQQAQRVPADAMTSLLARLKDTSLLVDKVLTNVRAITVELRPTLLDDMGVVPTLRWYLARFAERTGIQVQLDAPELPARLRPETETAIYRVVQEALTNIARHAQAHQVQVQLACAGETVIASVEDDGLGFDVEAWSERPGEQQTLGLTGMQERAMLLDGRVEIRSQPGQGTRIEIELPARFRSEGEG